MDLEMAGLVSGCEARAGMLAGMCEGLWADGLDGQEDELEDVEKGKLDPPTDDEGRGSIVERNNQGRGLESEDEDDSLVEGIEEKGVPDRRGDTGPSDSDRSDDELDELARKAGVRLPE